MGKRILAIAEVRDGIIRKVSLEAVQAAKLAAGADGAVSVLLAGNGVAALAAQLQSYGVTAVYVCDHSELDRYRPESYADAAQAALAAANADAVFCGHTAMGKDLAPLLAARLGAGQLSDVIKVEQDAAGNVIFTRPIYAGKAFERKRFVEGPWIVTIRPNNIPPAEPASDAAADIVAIPYPAPDLRTVVREVVRKTSGKVDLAEAQFIVSGGRGVKSAEGFKPLEELAQVLGGAVGASRGACDAGYCDYSLQIGQTGKVVTPLIYIACGISGAIQHVAGMSQAKVIIAVNKDPEAPIFQVADYGIVGDLFEVVPLLTAEFKKILAAG